MQPAATLPITGRFPRSRSADRPCAARPGEDTIDTPLLPEIARGRPEAVEACLARYSALVWGLARRFLNNPSDAEDAVQEIFVDVWSNAARFDPDTASEKTFIAMIARRRLIDRGRRARARPAPDALPDANEMLADVGADQTAEVERRDEASRIERLLDGLRPEQQRVIRLSVFESLSHAEIAERLEMPLGTVKTHIRRGLIEIRRLLDADD